MVVLDHLLELAAVLALLLLCLTLGLTLLDRGSLLPKRPLSALGSGVVVGIGAYGTGILALGLAGGLRPAPLGLFTAGAALFSGSAIASVRRLLREARTTLQGRWDRVALAVLALFAACMLIQASAPVGDWDSLVYHLEVPSVWWEEGRIHLPADNLHAAFTGLVHLLYVPLLAVEATSGPALLNALLACLLAVVLFELGDRYFDRVTGRIAMVGLFGSPVVVLVATTPRVDVTTTLFLAVGLNALLGGVFGARDSEAGVDEELAPRRCLHLAAIVLGLATGVKLLSLPALAAMAPVALWGLVRLAGSAPDHVKLSVRALGLFAAATVPGLLLRWYLADAPLYPYLVPRHLEPWLQGLYGSAWLPEQLAPFVDQAPWFTREPVSLRALLTDPASLTPEREGVLYFPTPLLWLLPLALFHFRDARFSTLTGVALLCLGLVVTWEPRTNLRYLLPALVFLTVAAGRLLSWAGDGIHTGAVRRSVIGALMAVCVAPGLLPFVLHWRESPVLGYLVGTVTAEQYYERSENPDIHLWPTTAAWLERRISDDDRVLLLFEPRGYFLDVPKIQDNLGSNWPLLARAPVGDVCAYLRRENVTHVLVNYGALTVHLRHGMPPEAVSWNSFPAFAKSCLVRKAARSPYVLYRLVEGNWRPSPNPTDSLPPPATRSGPS